MEFPHTPFSRTPPPFLPLPSLLFIPTYFGPGVLLMAGPPVLASSLVPRVTMPAPSSPPHVSLLSLNPATPHCVSKFLPSFGHLDWPSTWRTIFLLPLDRRVSDLNWQIAHGVLYTASRLSSFGYSLQTSCFCEYHSECLEHLFFACPLAQSAYAWIGTKLSLASPLAPSIDVRHALFGFSSDEMRCVPRVSAYLLKVCKYFVWAQGIDFRFPSVPPSAVRLVAAIKARLRFYLPLFFNCFISSRHRLFLRQWAANGVFGSISGSKFVCSI